MEVGIVLLPDQKLSTHTRKLSQFLSEAAPTEFQLSTDSFLPHLTLFQGVFSLEGIEKVKETLLEISKSHTAFSSRLHSYSELLGYVFFDLVPTPELAQLHKDIVEQVGALKSGLRIEFQDMLDKKSLSEKRLSYIKEYGYPLCFDEYIPHITLSRFKNPEKLNMSEIVAMLPSEPHPFAAKTIGLVKLGPHGSCSSVLSEFTLV